MSKPGKINTGSRSENNPGLTSAGWHLILTPLMKIQFYDLGAENQNLAPEFRTAFERILASGRFVLGPELAAFEQALADYLKVQQAIGLKSGTDALYFALRALGIGNGDQVITTPFTFPATIEAILRTGAQPVLVDIESQTLGLNPELLPAAITPRTRAILLVHLFGNCTDLQQFLTIARNYHLHLIEDAAQAIGSEYQGKKLGSFGSTAAISFYPTKNLGALGNGGALLLNPEINSEHNVLTEIPTSARLDELQAAFLAIKLRHLDQNLNRRREIATLYRTALGPFVRIAGSAPGSLPNYHQFAILVSDRDRLRAGLGSRGIETMVYYPEPIHHQQRFAYLFNYGQLPVAEQTAREILCLPIRQNLTEPEIQFIINNIIELLRRLK
jgi:dTDP-4-amino-4,6-dideoxygalactose transaminase